MQQTWLIGDIHGCLRTFTALLDKIPNVERASIYLTGDLINRGPQSAQTLDYLMNCPLSIKTVLGNHDLAFIAWHLKILKHSKSDDCFAQLSSNRQADKWIDWLRHQPLCIDHNNFTLVHAGLYPYWTRKQNIDMSRMIEKQLQKESFENAMSQLWQHANASAVNDNQAGFALNVFTRMRYLQPNRQLCLATKGLIALKESSFLPWFDLWPIQEKKIFFGHWSALEGKTNREDIVCLDHGCVWQKKLCAYHLESGNIIYQSNVDDLP